MSENIVKKNCSWCGALERKWRGSTVGLPPACCFRIATCKHAASEHSLKPPPLTIPLSLSLSLQWYRPWRFSSGWLPSAKTAGVSEEIYGPRLEPRCAEAQVLNLLITPVIVPFIFAPRKGHVCNSPGEAFTSGCRQRHKAEGRQKDQRGCQEEANGKPAATGQGLQKRQQNQKKDNMMSFEDLAGRVIGTCISRLLLVFVCNLHRTEAGQSDRGRRQPS